MPFVSKAQRRYMHARHPEIAERWEREHSTPKHLPKRVKRRPRGSGVFTDREIAQGYRRVD